MLAFGRTLIYVVELRYIIKFVGGRRPWLGIESAMNLAVELMGFHFNRKPRVSYAASRETTVFFVCGIHAVYSGIDMDRLIGDLVAGTDVWSGPCPFNRIWP